nr:hypothetical protein [uncultured archaeon]
MPTELHVSAVGAVAAALIDGWLSACYAGSAIAGLIIDLYLQRYKM